MLRVASMIALAATIMLAPGCRPRPPVGGSSGVLRSAGQALADVQVTVYRTDGSTWTAIGFADTTSDGSFKLFTPGAQGPLELTPGEYRFTLESVGSPVRIPPAYAKADSTPLRVVWPTSDNQLNLEITERLVAP